jgi:hypothetical protein
LRVGFEVDPRDTQGAERVGEHQQLGLISRQQICARVLPLMNYKDGLRRFLQRRGFLDGRS